MGIPVVVTETPPAGDAANAVVTGTLGSATTGSSFLVYGAFNFAVWGTFVGTVILERTYDGGTTWIPVCFNNSATAVSLTAPNSITLGEPERGVAYRPHCTLYTSGTISYRMSASGMMAQSAGASTV